MAGETKDSGNMSPAAPEAGSPRYGYDAELVYRHGYGVIDGEQIRDGDAAPGTPEPPQREREDAR
jgi:hypothetical protein